MKNVNTQKTKKLSKPYVITIKNKSDSPIENIELFSAYDKAYELEIFNEKLEVKVSGNGLEKYRQLLFGVSMMPFAVGLTRLSIKSDSEGFAKQQLNIAVKLKQMKDFKWKDDELYFGKPVKGVGKYYFDNDTEYKIDAFSKMTIPYLLAKTTLKIDIYPVKNPIGKNLLVK